MHLEFLLIKFRFLIYTAHQSNRKRSGIAVISFDIPSVFEVIGGGGISH